MVNNAKENKLTLDELWEIFEGMTEYGHHYEIVEYDGEVSIFAENYGGAKYLVLYIDDKEIERNAVTTPTDAFLIYEEYYDTYISEEGLPFTYDDTEIDNVTGYGKWTIQDEIEEREEELQSAFEDLLVTIGGGRAKNHEDIAKEIKEKVLKYIADHYPKEINIYRPMCILDATGNEHYEEYPYDEWEF